MRSYRLASGVSVDDLSPEELLNVVARSIEAGRSVHICTLNPEIVDWCDRNAPYREAVEGADIRTIDGIGVSLAVWRRWRRWLPRLTGVMLLDLLVRWVKETDRQILIVGAEEGSREAAEQRLRAGGVRVIPGLSPRVREDGREENREEPPWPTGGVVFVALGPPKQELWIRRKMAEKPPPNVFIGVGGAVNYASGFSRKPSPWVRAAGMEWLYRLVHEPRKRFRRQMQSLPRFFWREILLARPGPRADEV